MSDLLSGLEQSIVDALKASKSLGMVKTYETSFRECLYTGSKLTLGFRPEEMPVIAVSCREKPMESDIDTPAQEIHQIPVTVTIVTRAQNAKQADAAASEIWDALRYELGQFCRSGNALGSNTVVMGKVTSSATPIDEKPLAFVMRAAEFTITKITQL
jgi:hypothetical protein